MSQDNHYKYPISENLYELTENQVANLDHEVTDGEGWSCYCNGYISQTTVFKNKISGRFKDYFLDHVVEVVVDDRQITTFCSTCRQGQICVHVVALLYSWIYDQEGFINLAESLNYLEHLDKNALIDIIGAMLINNPGNLEYFNRKLDEDDNHDLGAIFG